MRQLLTTRALRSRALRQAVTVAPRPVRYLGKGGSSQWSLHIHGARVDVSSDQCTVTRPRWSGYVRLLVEFRRQPAFALAPDRIEV